MSQSHQAVESKRNINVEVSNQKTKARIRYIQLAKLNNVLKYERESSKFENHG